MYNALRRVDDEEDYCYVVDHEPIVSSQDMKCPHMQGGESTCELVESESSMSNNSGDPDICDERQDTRTASQSQKA